MPSERDASRIIVATAAAGGFLSVAAGAFGAHVLRARLDTVALDVFQTGALYLMFHSLALLALGALQSGPLRTRWFERAAICMAAGTAVFSGSLMLLALTGMRWLGAVAPFGGTLLLAGWLCVVRGAWREQRE